jgi:hypothetical protein
MECFILTSLPPITRAPRELPRSGWQCICKSCVFGVCLGGMDKFALVARYSLYGVQKSKIAEMRIFTSMMSKCKRQPE